MDGAGGLYSLMMGLIICDVVPYDKACSFSGFSSKSKIGMLFEELANSSPLYKQGTTADDIVKAINKYFPEEIDFQIRERKRKGPNIINFIDQKIIKNYPVLLILTYEGGAHWVLVIGRECEKNEYGAPPTIHCPRSAVATGHMAKIALRMLLTRQIHPG